MIKQNGILSTGKITIKALLLSSMLVCSANADFLMTLTDKNGVEENICVKSYSFSNTLESLHKQESQTKDVYSTEETLTNKTWLGKPVYRRVMPIEDTNVPYSTQYTIKYTDVVSQDLDVVVNLSYSALKDNTYLATEGNNSQVFFPDGRSHHLNGNFRYDLKQAQFNVKNHSDINKTWKYTNINFVIEYTKTTDVAQTQNDNLAILVNYLPSNSTTGEYLVKSLKNVKIGFFENYTYDATTDSCIAPTN